MQYNYFNDGPIRETIEGTYAERGAELSQDYVMWNHSLEDVLMNLISKGLDISSFREYDYSPYNCFKGMIEDEAGKFRIEQVKNKLPLVYALVEVKNI